MLLFLYVNALKIIIVISPFIFIIVRSIILIYFLFQQYHAISQSLLLQHKINYNYHQFQYCYHYISCVFKKELPKIQFFRKDFIENWEKGNIDTISQETLQYFCNHDDVINYFMEPYKKGNDDGMVKLSLALQLCERDNPKPDYKLVKYFFEKYCDKFEGMKNLFDFIALVAYPDENSKNAKHNNKNLLHYICTSKYVTVKLIDNILCIEEYTNNRSPASVQFSDGSYMLTNLVFNDALASNDELSGMLELIMKAYPEALNVPKKSVHDGIIPSIPKKIFERGLLTCNMIELIGATFPSSFQIEDHNNLYVTDHVIRSKRSTQEEKFLCIAIQPFTNFQLKENVAIAKDFLSNVMNNINDYDKKKWMQHGVVELVANLTDDDAINAFCTMIEKASFKVVKSLKGFVNRTYQALYDKCQPKIKTSINEKLIFMKRFDIADQTPIHQSDTAIVLKAIDVKTKEFYLEKFLAVIGNNENVGLNQSQFIETLQSIDASFNPSDNVFEKWDRDGNNTISEEEWSEMLSKTTNLCKLGLK